MKRLKASKLEDFKDYDVLECETNKEKYDEDTASARIHYIVRPKYQDQKATLYELANLLDGHYPEKVCMFLKLNINTIAGKIQEQLSEFAMPISARNINVRASQSDEYIDVYFETTIEG